jgi:hypothetical protein
LSNGGPTDRGLSDFEKDEELWMDNKDGARFYYRQIRLNSRVAKGLPLL